MTWVTAAFSMLGNYMAGKEQASASRALAQAQADISRARTASGNSQSQLARTIQDINNRRRMKAAEVNVKASAENIERMKTDFARGNLEGQIRGIEQLGAFSANVSTRGTMGNSLDAIRSTIQLTQQRKEQATKANQNLSLGDAVQRHASIIPDAFAGWDFTVRSGSVATDTTIPDFRQPPNYVDMLSKMGVFDYLGDLGRNKTEAPSQPFVWNGAAGFQGGFTSPTNQPLRPQATQRFGFSTPVWGAGAYNEL